MLSIIVLSYNALEYTKKCLDSIKQWTQTPFEIIVVDNNSEDGSKEWLRTQDITFVDNKENKGVAGGRNQGIKAARGEYVVFLDNDATVGEGWDKRMLSVFTGFGLQKVGVVGRMGANWDSFTFSGNQPVQDQDWPTEAQVICGAVQMFRRELVDEIGLLDENMNPFWHEDSEFCIRANYFGYKNYIHKFNWVHEDGGHKSGFDQAENLTSPNSLYMRNLKYMEEKYKYPLTIYREEHQNCSESLCIVTDRITKSLRDQGMIVTRKGTFHTGNKSFDLHNGLVMEYKGKKIAWIHCENDRPAKSWFAADEKFDYYFPASYHVRNALIRAGFDKEKFFYTSLDGLQEEFNYETKPETFYPGTFKFFNYGATQPRKYTDGLIKAYCKAFTDKDNVILIIKDYKYGHRNWTETLIEMARQENLHCPRIEYIFDDWDTKKLAGVLKAVANEGAYVHPSRSEGFGLPVLEALAVGCRVGTTKYGGVLDFASRDATLFDYKLVSSTFHKNQAEPYYEKNENPKWAEPDIDSIVKWMKRIVKEPYDHNDRKVVADTMVKKYNFDIIAKKVKKDLESIGKSEKRFDSDYYGKDYWDGKTSSYTYYTECDVHKWDAEALMETFNLQGKKCLDLGCCFGYQVKYLNLLGADGYGCDISHYAVDHAYDPSRIKWADLEKRLPYEDKSFDFVFSISTMEHLSYEGLDHCLKEVKRILKPGGYFFDSPGIVTQKEFFNDKSHQIQETADWWDKKMEEKIGPSDRELVNKFMSISRSAKMWDWSITANRK